MIHNQNIDLITTHNQKLNKNKVFRRKTILSQSLFKIQWCSSLKDVISPIYYGSVAILSIKLLIYKSWNLLSQRQLFTKFIRETMKVILCISILSIAVANSFNVSVSDLNEDYLKDIFIERASRISDIRVPNECQMQMLYMSKNWKAFNIFPSKFLDNAFELDI